MDILQPASGAARMGHLLRAVKITGFVIKWGAHLSTLAAGVWMLHGMVVIKLQANKEQKLLENHLVKREGREGKREGKKYEDNAKLMDIYSFPGYQVEIEVPTNPDGSSKQVILDEAIWDEVDPVVLGEAGISVYEIPNEKKKLPVDNWVDMEDLGMDDDTHPEDVGPVEMATPAPKQKVWLASNVHRTSPVQYSEVDTTTDRPDISTARTPRAQSTRRQGRSLVTPKGDVISEARIGTIPYMAVWVMFFCILLTMMMNLAITLSDHDRQVIAYNCGKPTEMRAYDTGERNHWCDLNPLMDSTNTDVALTNVSYVLLQKVPRVRSKLGRARSPRPLSHSTVVIMTIKRL
jgi:hypothetical protein